MEYLKQPKLICVCEVEGCTLQAGLACAQAGFASPLLIMSLASRGFRLAGKVDGFLQASSLTRRTEDTRLGLIGVGLGSTAS